MNTCKSIAFIPMTVRTEISLKPRIRKLPITASIKGCPVLKPTPWGSYILTQELSVKVPIEIIVESNIEGGFPSFGNAKSYVNVVIDNKCK